MVTTPQAFSTLLGGTIGIGVFRSPYPTSEDPGKLYAGCHSEFGSEFDCPNVCASDTCDPAPDSDFGSHERYAGGRRPEGERTRSAVEPPSSCRIESSAEGKENELWFHALVSQWCWLGDVGDVAAYVMLSYGNPSPLALALALTDPPRAPVMLPTKGVMVVMAGLVESPWKGYS